MKATKQRNNNTYVHEWTIPGEKTLIAEIMAPGSPLDVPWFIQYRNLQRATNLA
jgi:hypothetical protein